MLDSIETPTQLYPGQHLAVEEFERLSNLSPDLSFVRNEQLPFGRSPKGYGNFAPDLVVEIISPSDRAGNVGGKVQKYLANRTRLIWVIHPDLRSATVYHPDGSAHQLTDKDILDGEKVLPGFACQLSDIL